MENLTWGLHENMTFMIHLNMVMTRGENMELELDMGGL